MRYIVLAIVLAFASAHGDEWTPPENPDPQAILQEARGDTDAKRYEIALAKHLWFHKNALTIRPSLYGVRLSFALSDWHRLAKEHPPALTKLEETRDEAAQKVMECNDVRASFHDMAAINRTLGKESLTKETFEALDSKNPKAAKRTFGVAQPALLKGKAYGLLAKYIDPEADFSKMTANYRRGKRLADNPRFVAIRLEFARKKFANDAATLVAILTIVERKAEAEEIALAAKEEWDGASFRATLDRALQGTVPDPWP